MEQNQINEPMHPFVALYMVDTGNEILAECHAPPFAQGSSVMKVAEHIRDNFPAITRAAIGWVGEQLPLPLQLAEPAPKLLGADGKVLHIEDACELAEDALTLMEQTQAANDALYQDAA